MSEQQNDAQDVTMSSNAPLDGGGAQKATAAQLQEIFKATTSAGSGALGSRAVLKPREVTFTLDGAVGALKADGSPVFSTPEGEILDIEITLQGMTSAQELDAIQGVTDGVRIPFVTAKAQICKVDGQPISPAFREWLWEAIGQGGRQLCVIASQQVAGAGQGVLGKFQTSMHVGSGR